MAVVGVLISIEVDVMSLPSRLFRWQWKLYNAGRVKLDLGMLATEVYAA